MKKLYVKKNFTPENELKLKRPSLKIRTNLAIFRQSSPRVFLPSAFKYAMFYPLLLFKYIHTCIRLHTFIALPPLQRDLYIASKGKTPKTPWALESWFMEGKYTQMWFKKNGLFHFLSVLWSFYDGTLFPNPLIYAQYKLLYL